MTSPEVSVDVAVTWRDQAACRGMGPDLFYAVDTAAARAVCAVCPVTVACADAAERLSEPDGIWGGQSTWERTGAYSPHERLAEAAAAKAAARHERLAEAAAAKAAARHERLAEAAAAYNRAVGSVGQRVLAMAAAVGVTERHAWRVVAKARTAGLIRAHRACACGETFTPAREWQIHCSPACRQNAKNARWREAARQYQADRRRDPEYRAQRAEYLREYRRKYGDRLRARERVRSRARRARSAEEVRTDG